MSFLSPERLEAVYQNAPANARKKLPFFKKFEIPHKRPLIANKAPFISTRPSHQESGIERLPVH